MTRAAGVFVTAAVGAACWAIPARALQRDVPKDAIMLTLDSPACPEGCADFSVAIVATRDAGTVTYKGMDHVLVQGMHHAELTRLQARQLAKMLQEPHAAGSAASPLTLTVAKGPARSPQGPSHDAELIARISALIGLDRWTRGNAETIPSLQHEGWDFHASDPEHANLLVSAAGEGNLVLVTQLLTLGAPVNAHGPGKSLPLFAAIEGHHSDVVAALLHAGADRSLRSSDGELALDMANELGYQDIVALLH